MASPSIQLRAAPALSITTPLSTSKISIRHPGYPDAGAKNEMLLLPAFDGPDGGLHHGTVRLACAIVAGNIWNGSLAVSRGGQRLPLRDDDMLPKGTYYFYPEADDAGRYPVVPNFQHWVFPDVLPPGWSPEPNAAGNPRPPIPAASAMTAYIKMRDQGCQISHDQDQVERAHLVPRDEGAWFRGNNMRRYNRNQALPDTYLLDDGSNSLALRPDIHNEFDDAGFVFTRKHQQWAVHFLRETHNLGPTFHNTIVNLKEEVSPEFLLARFAWAIFPLVRSFVDLGPKRTLLVRAGADGESTSVIEELDNDAIKKITQHPKKPRHTGQERPGGDQTNSGDSRRTRPCRPDSGFASDWAACAISSPSSPTERLQDTLAGSGDGQQATFEPSTWEERLDEMKLRLLRDQRVTDPALLCCDYEDAEARMAQGFPGKRKYGGAYLCTACLGDEYWDQDLPPFDNDEVNDNGNQ